MDFKSFFGQTLLGLDVQPGYVRAVSVKRRWCDRQVVVCAEKRIPEEVHVANVIKQWSILQRCLQELVAEQKWQGCKVAIGLAAPLVRHVQLQVSERLSPADIARAIEVGLQREFPAAAEPLIVDFVSRKRKYGASMWVDSVAAERSYVEKYVAVVNAAGFNVRVVDLNDEARLRAEDYLSQPEAIAPRFYCALGLALRAVPT